MVGEFEGILVSIVEGRAEGWEEGWEDTVGWFDGLSMGDKLREEDGCVVGLKLGSEEG